MADWPDDQAMGVPAGSQLVLGQYPECIPVIGAVDANSVSTIYISIANNGRSYRLVSAFIILYAPMPMEVMIYLEKPIGSDASYLFAGMVSRNVKFVASADQNTPLVYGDRYVITMENFEGVDRAYYAVFSAFGYV